jgi:hypothetical protein
MKYRRERLVVTIIVVCSILGQNLGQNKLTNQVQGKNVFLEQFLVQPVLLLLVLFILLDHGQSHKLFCKL